jgi:hypothetical protein
MRRRSAPGLASLPSMFRCALVALLMAAFTTVGCGGSEKRDDGIGTGARPGATPTTGDPNFHVYLLLGQSNMEGQPKAEAADRAIEPRVKVLQYDDCTNFARKYDQWYTAIPPLHGCFAGVGPGDYFGKALAAAFPEATIGLVPCAISGVDIDMFRKGIVSARRSEFRIPPDDHWEGAYAWVLERARLAQQAGTIKGIIFHQGESDNGDIAWLDKVQELVTDLRRDLGLGEVPFVAGELLYGGCCDAHNPIINMLPSKLSNASVVSAEELLGMDDAHFDLAGQRELGTRYGNAMLEALK